MKANKQGAPRRGGFCRRSRGGGGERSQQKTPATNTNTETGDWRPEPSEFPITNYNCMEVKFWSHKHAGVDLTLKRTSKPIRIGAI